MMNFCNILFRLALALLLLILVGCNEKEEFLTPDHNYVLNVTHEGLFLNGEQIGGVVPFREKMEQYRPPNVMQTEPLVFHIHFDEGFNYGQFYSLLSEVSHADEIQVAIGEHYDDPLDISLAGRLDTCNMQLVRLRQSLQGKGVLGSMAKETPLDEVGLKKREQNCAENFMKLSLTINGGSGQNYDYVIRLNELGIVGGEKSYRYENRESLLEALKEIHSRKNLANKQDKDNVVFIASNDIPLSVLYGMHRDLRKLGYVIASLGAFYR